MADYTVICARVQSPAYSAASASSYQVAVVSPLPGPSTLLGTLGSALAHIDTNCRGTTVDDAGQILLQRFKQEGLWATCRMSPDSASTKGSVILKRSRELERRGDESRTDAMRREWMMSQKLEVFYVFPEDSALHGDQLLQAAYLLDRIGDTESLIGVTKASVLRDVPAQEIGSEEILVDTLTPVRAFQNYAIGGYVLRFLQTLPNFPGLADRESELFFLPVVVETQRGLDKYQPSQFRGLPISGSVVLRFDWQGYQPTVVIPPTRDAPEIRRRRR